MWEHKNLNCWAINKQLLQRVCRLKCTSVLELNALTTNMKSVSIHRYVQFITMAFLYFKFLFRIIFSNFTSWSPIFYKFSNCPAKISKIANWHLKIFKKCKWTPPNFEKVMLTGAPISLVNEVKKRTFQIEKTLFFLLSKNWLHNFQCNTSYICFLNWCSKASVSIALFKICNLVYIFQF